MTPRNGNLPSRTAVSRMTPSSYSNQRKDHLILFSPAKINLFFRVLHRRSDDYHEIASLYQAITLGDHLTLTLSHEDLLTSNNPHLPTDRTNLIYRSLDLFRKKTGQHFPVHFHVEKNIPIEAGLGGGSSNAATAMWALNALSNNPVSNEELATWVSEFSSDAPFFFSEGTAYCSGRGEILEKIEPLAKTSLWIAKPVEGLSTPLVFKNCEPALFKNRDPRNALIQALSGALDYFNDLEVPAFRLLPKLLELKEQLLHLGFSQVVMTGSGTAFFCIGTISEAPSIPGVTFYPVSFQQRDAHGWYSEILQ